MYGSAFLKQKIGLFLLCLCMLLPSAAFAEVQTYEADGYYTMGDGLEENVKIAKERALEDAKDRARQQAGTFVRKIVSTKNHQIVESKITTLTSTVIQVNRIDYTPEPVGDVIRYRCHIVAVVDDGQVLAMMLEKKELEEALEREQEKDERIAELNRQMEDLKRQYQTASTVGKKDEIRQQVKANENSFTAAQWVEKAIRACNAKDYTKAIAYCNTAIELDPKSDGGYRILGDTYFQLRDYSKALECYQKMIPLVPDDYGHEYAALGDVYYAMGDYSKSIECYSKALEKNPYIYNSISRSGNVYKKLLQACDAKGGGYEKAIEAYNRVITKKIYGTVFSYNELGVVYDKMGDYSTAIEWFNKVMTKFPEYEETYYNLGKTYSHKGENKKAVEYYEKYKEKLGAYDDDGYFKLGNAYSDIGEYNKAIECFNKVIARNPTADAAYNNRGGAYEALGRRKEAKRDYAKAYELEPSDEIYRKNKKLSETW